MDEIGEMNERDIERLLSGRMPVGEEAPELARFLRDLDATYPEPRIDHCEAAHLSAIFAAARQVAETESPAASASRTPKSAPRAPARRFSKWAGVKLAIPVAVMLFAFGGAALAGGLVYHEASNAGGSTEVTQPGPGDTVLDTTDGDTADAAAIVGGDQGNINNPDDAAAIEENDRSERGDPDDATVEERERGEQDDTRDAAVEEDDRDDHPSEDQPVDEDQADPDEAGSPRSDSDTAETSAGPNVAQESVSSTDATVAVPGDETEYEAD